MPFPPLKETQFLLNKLQKPACPHFGSGPVKKIPGWTPELLKDALVARSHRANAGAERIHQVIQKMRRVLDVPKDYHVGITPGSATGAVEMALWSFLGPCPVDVFAWDVFGKLWVADICQQLPLKDTRAFIADFGMLPPLVEDYCSEHDTIFTWNGTSAGVMVPDAAWISDVRTGLVICDATSAAFARRLPWSKLDVTCFSWQKGLGGEAAHGVIVVSPRALERLQRHKPMWPVPRLFRLFNAQGDILSGFFDGQTINTPSMLCVEDAWQALEWAENLGGMDALEARCLKNYAVMDAWLANHPFLENLCVVPEQRSTVSVCFKPRGLTPEMTESFVGYVTKTLDDLGVAYDVKNHSLAPVSFRVWCGPTIDSEDLHCLTQWIDTISQHFLKMVKHLL